MARHDVGEQTDHQRERLGEYPEELHERHDRQGQFQVDRRFGPKDLFPVRFRGEQVDRYKRTKCQYACYRYISRNISASRENRYDPDQVIDQDKEKYRQQIGRERLIFFSDRLFDHPVLYVGDGHFHQSDKSARRLVRVLFIPMGGSENDEKQEAATEEQSANILGQ